MQAAGQSSASGHGAAQHLRCARYQIPNRNPSRYLQQAACACLVDIANGIRPAARMIHMDVGQYYSYLAGTYRPQHRAWLKISRGLALPDHCAVLLHYGIQQAMPHSKKEADPVVGRLLCDAVLELALKRYPSPTLRAIAKRYYDALALAAAKTDNPPADPAP